MLDRTRFLSSPSQLIEEHGERLRSLIDAQLHGAWIAWDTEAGEWCTGEPVILQLGGQQLEIVCWKYDEIALTWGQVDLDRKPSHVMDWGDIHLEWRENAHEVLKAVHAGTLETITVLEHRFRYHTKRESQWYEKWQLHGLEFQLTDGVFSVYNAMDENGLDGQVREGPDFRRTEIKNTPPNKPAPAP